MQYISNRRFSRKSPRRLHPACNFVMLYLTQECILIDANTFAQEFFMLSGVSKATKKNGEIYYRAGMTYRGKHISLGSFSSEEDAAGAYLDARKITGDTSIGIVQLHGCRFTLSFEKAMILINFRDNGIYFKNPIYLHKGYFSYFLSPELELKFDIDDLFYYSSHKIQRRQGHLFVSDYGMQYSIPARYGIRPYAVAGRDYEFANGDTLDYRYSNIIIHNHYHGVQRTEKNGVSKYRASIHINGNYLIGVYPTEETAAIAYNKAADLAKASGVRKNFPENYIEGFSGKKYAEVYTRLHISKRYLDYLASFTSG